MSFWDRAFDDDLKQRKDIDRLRFETETSTEELETLRHKVQRLELTVEALLEVLRLKQQLTRAELRQMIVRLDLADGSEDDQIGPLLSSAPTCAHCGEHVNPRRRTCVYCNRTLTIAAPKGQARQVRPPRDVACQACGEEVLESSTYFTERGMVCTPCFHDPDRSTRQAGQLSLTEGAAGGELSLPPIAGALSIDE